MVVERLFLRDQSDILKEDKDPSLITVFISEEKPQMSPNCQKGVTYAQEGKKRNPVRERLLWQKLFSQGSLQTRGSRKDLFTTQGSLKSLIEILLLQRNICVFCSRIIIQQGISVPSYYDSYKSQKKGKPPQLPFSSEVNPDAASTFSSIFLSFIIFVAHTYPYLR